MNNSSKAPTPHQLLAVAIRIAAEAHESQTDRGGNAYVLHPLRLMFRLRTDDAELMQIAVLHDAIEDSDVTPKTLYDLGFGDRVVGALQCLTHPPEEPYDNYIERVATNADAVRVKLEDLRDNSDITRLKGVRAKDLERIEKYHKSYLFLKNTLET